MRQLNLLYDIIKKSWLDSYELLNSNESCQNGPSNYDLKRRTDDLYAIRDQFL